MLFLIIFIATLATSYVLPWWAMAVIAFGASLYAGTRTTATFWSGFAAVFLVYTIIALLKSAPNDHLLANRVAVLFHLPNWIFLLAVTATIGGLVGGASALSGLYVRRVFINDDAQKKAS
ncbi:hypothetical protein ACFQ3S_06715 [Mucilaginibacter terrae]|uniref:hypothetical protein n=1 Tax=Mucilaginibacter terrae TaxID=1955052 RepID=UPI0036290030